MKFLLMMTMGKNTVDCPPIQTWPMEDIRAHIAFMMTTNQELTARGEFVAAEGLAGPEQAVIVRASREDGSPVTDGVFPESKEFLAGYWFISVDSAERAHAIAAHISTAPGPGGRPLYLPIEVRQVMDGPPPEFL